MKKVIRTVLLLILVLSLSTAIVPCASAASDTTQNKAAVYRYLTNTLGLNRAAACGIMANVEKESNFNPKDVAVDSNGKLSGGLFQWNGSRFTNLKNYCSKNGYNYLSITGQMNYLKAELSTKSYSGIFKHMKGVSNDSSGAYDAGYYWCYYFERPANKSSRSVQRGNLAKTYFKNYAPPTITLSVPKVTVGDSDLKIALMDNVNLSWTDGGKDCTSYIVKIARYENGEYNWKTATSAYSVVKNFSLFAYNLGLGKYSAKVYSKNDASGQTKVSSAVKFSIVCANHVYTSKITKKPTDTKTGIRTYTCTICKATYSQTIQSAEKAVKSLAAPKVTAKTNFNSVAAIKYSGSSKADGYTIYVDGGGQWFKLATQPAGTSTRIPDMYSGTKIKVVAFKTCGSKTITSPGTTVKL